MFDLLTYTLRTYTYTCLSIQIYLPLCISEISSVPLHFSDTTRSPKQSHEPFNKGRQENSADVVIAALTKALLSGSGFAQHRRSTGCPFEERGAELVSRDFTVPPVLLSAASAIVCFCEELKRVRDRRTQGPKTLPLTFTNRPLCQDGTVAPVNTLVF